MDYVDLIGKPYVKDARGPAAYDCWGVIMELAKRSGKAVHDPFAGGPHKIEGNAHQWLVEMFRGWTRKTVWEPGDVVAFCMERPGVVDHAGFVVDMVDGGRFVQALCKVGVVRMRLQREPFMSKLAGIYGYSN